MKNIIISILLASVFAQAESKFKQYQRCEYLKRIPQVTLDQYYNLSKNAMTIPEGPTVGCVVGWTSSPFNPILTTLMNQLWAGKTFDGKTKTLKNNVLGFEIVQADVYVGKSLFDGQDTIVIDYSKEKFPYNRVRDEIREVTPGLYLGRAYLMTSRGPVLAANFALFQ